MIDLTEEQKLKARALRDNLQFYAKNCLKIKDKQGQLVPFVFNKAQEYIHEKLEEQKRRTGKVRALILKGRQEGCSTLIEARFFHKACWNYGVSVGTISHLSDTTDKLYAIINRFFENLPPTIKPPLPINNMRKIKIAVVDSEWDLGTAGSDEIGRGGTLICFHGSEISFWPHPEKMRAGILQSVSDMPGTEVILESTGNGMDGFFYPMCMQAMQCIGDFILIFVPWSLMAEYRKAVDDSFQKTEEEIELAQLYGLDNEQLAWRRAKIVELGSIHEFRREYPNDPADAFRSSGDSFISSEKVLRARRNQIDRSEYQNAPLIIGVDPARTHDRFVISFRKGRKLLRVLIYDPRAKTSYKSPDGRLVVEPMTDMKDTVMAGIISHFLQSYEPRLCNVDVGYGWGIVDILHEQKFKNVRPVLFHESADEPTVYANKRAEIWHRLRDWVHGTDGEVDIPDEDMIQSDFCSMPQPKPSSNSRVMMVPKDEIIKKFLLSPDIAESVALTLAFLVNAPQSENSRVKKANADQSGVRSAKKKRSGGTREDFSPGNIFSRP